jgi:kumamolisin
MCSADAPREFSPAPPCTVAWRRWLLRAAFVLSLVLLPGPSMRAGAGPASRASLPESIREIPIAANAADATGRLRPRVVRTALTAEETAAKLEFEVSFRMRNFAELQERILRHEVISHEEMAAKYLPPAADYRRMAAWLASQGFTIVRQGEGHLGIFAEGAISRIAEVFGTTFARVAHEGGEYTSAVTAPSVPAALAPAMLGINGLQPHVRVHKHSVVRTPGATVFTPHAVITPPYSPSQILHAYHGADLGLDGTGQIVADVIDTFPNDSDLTAFWSLYNVPASLANVTKIQVVSGTLPTPTGEESVDVQWSTAMAPGIQVRVYAVGSLTFSRIYQGLQQVINDRPSLPGLRQLMLCFGANESDISAASQQTEAQYLAAVASSGITIFASSGDGGSNPDSTTGRYNSAAALQVCIPASDPSVTSIGGTSATFDDANGGTITSETGWSGSGGGISSAFNRPGWQTGASVPAGSQRLVPDLAVVADPYTGVYIYLNGQRVQVGGTSLSTPMWSGFGAMINQLRAATGLQPLGQFGAYVYPLIGTASFTDITSGSNGAYSAGPGYDMVTGIGVPNLAALTAALSPSIYAPVFLKQPAGLTVLPGQTATFSAPALGNPTPTYRWQRLPAGSATWADIDNNTTYGGSSTNTLTVSSATETMSGDAFRCRATNGIGVGTATTAPVFLGVSVPLVFTTLAGQAGSWGSADGNGGAARFYDPADVAADAGGNVYVADANNHTIRKITPVGMVTTLAGAAGSDGSVDGTGSAARFNFPLGVAVDGAGIVYAADTHNYTIRQITSAGVVTTGAGQAGQRGGLNGTGTAAQFSDPTDLTVDGSGNLFVTDTTNQIVRKIAPGWIVSTFAGCAQIAGSADGVGTAALFHGPQGVSADRSGNLYVADSYSNTIRAITSSGTVTTPAGAAGVNGSAYGLGSAARFDYPADLAPDGAGNLYVVDCDNHTVRKVTPSGMVITVAGLAGSSGTADGTGSAARFNSPTGIAVDTAGNVYVADTSNHTIRKGVPASAPVIQTHPQSQTVTTGYGVQFSVTVAGAPAPTYQWRKDGVAISSATASSYSISSALATDAGSYTVVATNFLGSATSNAATLTVTAVTPPPSGGGGGGGGGGAIEAWFALGIILLAARRASRHSGR